jgi:hypothetical protein
MTDEQYQQAEERARIARVRFMGALSVARSRVTPARLKANAQAKLSQATSHAASRARATVVRHPFTTGSVLAALAAWLFRRPLGALSRHLFVRGRDWYRARISEDEE